MTTVRKSQYAFTIVELLIVIVAIAILAAISLVAFNGIQKRALVAALESDLGGSSKQLQLFKADKGNFPATVSTNCGASPNSETNLCLKLSGGNDVDNYTSPSPHTTFSLTIIHTASGLSGTVTDSSGPIITGATTVPGGGGEDGIVIGDQVWARANLNVGVRVDGNISQTDNETVEKYCPYNKENHCTTYGALYEWNEAMQYTNVPGARGICPAGWRIPTDDDWKVLEASLGMAQDQINITAGWRGTDQGAQIKLRGTTGLDIPYAGWRSPAGGFGQTAMYGGVWTSSENGGRAWRRGVTNQIGGSEKIYRGTESKVAGYSVRCLKDQ